MTSSATELLDRVRPIAERAAATLVALQGSRLDVHRKELRDVVTEADLASECIVVEGLRMLTPEAAIMSEEIGVLDGQNATWIVDPLDRTINYAAGLPWFSVSIAYQEGERTRVGLLNAPAAGIIACYTDDGIATMNGRPVKVSSTRQLADAVVSVILTSHFTTEEVARTAEVIRRLGDSARGVRIIGRGERAAWAAVERSERRGELGVAAGMVESCVTARLETDLARMDVVPAVRR